MGGGSSYIISKGIIEIYENKYPYNDEKNKINKHMYICLSTLFGMSLGLLRYKSGKPILSYYLQ